MYLNIYTTSSGDGYVRRHRREKMPTKANPPYPPLPQPYFREGSCIALNDPIFRCIQIIYILIIQYLDVFKLYIF